ncbi:hypothetical protein Adt_42334 [Abeliophyllum distichum]|uniref:Retrotransposon gag domain-containing protein n=1 Tax=Abeliophyllum distichum TaxID=126358 RepID=A0ABD1PRE2_9LAMI
MKLQGYFLAVKCRNFHTTFVSDVNYEELTTTEAGIYKCLYQQWTTAVDVTQLHDTRQKEDQSVKSYLKRFIKVINKIENITNDKAPDALITRLCIRTPFWRGVQNRDLKTYRPHSVRNSLRKNH